ncbi:MAG: TOBE domain-containing protein, partial [Hasllibacter sp.]
VTHDQIEAMTLGDRIVVMRGGRIMQAGSPEELFLRPANLFVAGVIGRPPQKFLPARVEEGRVAGDGFAVAADPARTNPLAGREVTVGLRPTAFRRDAAGDIAFRAHISEYLGSSSVLVGRLSAARVQIEIETPAPVRVGETLHLSVDPDQLHLFDPQTEAAL